MKKIKIGILIILSIIFLTEIGLRLFAKKKLTKWTQPSYQTDSIIGWRYEPNSEGIKIRQVFQNQYKINSQGFNWDEFLIEKGQGVFRIAIIGSSDDAGMDTDGPDCYPRLLQKYFKENKDKVEILNFAIDGKHRGYKDLQLIEKECINYNPDLILMRVRFPIVNKILYRTSYKGYSIGYGDINASLEITKKYIDENFLDQSIFTFFFDNSYIYRYICKYTIENEKGSETFIRSYLIKDLRLVNGYARNSIGHLDNKKKTIKYFTKEESINMYKETNELLEKKNISFVLFNTYSDFSLNHVNGLLAKNEISYLDLNIPFISSYSFGKIDGHSSQEGHEVMAKSFYEKFYTKDIVPKKYFSDKTKLLMQDVEKQN